jgi:hypothetical protein
VDGKMESVLTVFSKITKNMAVSKNVDPHDVWQL